ncbi:2TM domain-containing protein [Ideonella paludis]|uniref:2TM domain-containing protein n=1 Tax=Ideonella paludis TaxID=1233411 RepID=A0ABS5DX04_9BURK|nr:2TM domain-containing protein [Ideonella paludis]MBQ0935681.1 2TM domain-containing protein [Ideonella paludis]
MSTTHTPDLYAQAEDRVNRKIGLMTHAAIYVLVNLGLYLLAQQRDAHWNLFPLLGWGVGLFFHALGTWLSLSRDGWRQRMVEAEAAKLRGPR